MATLLGIHGSVTYPGRLYHALEYALNHVGEQDNSLTTDLMHLGDFKMSFADGRELADYQDDTEHVVARILSADMFLIATPVFRATFTGALKNLFDLVPVEGFLGKPCGLIAMGATDHHYLSVDTQLRPVLAWFGAQTIPGLVYLKSSHFSDGKLSEPTAMTQLESLASSVNGMNNLLTGDEIVQGPKPLAS